MDQESLIEAAVQHCTRDSDGLLKIGDLWMQPEKEWQKHELLKRHPELKAQVVVRTGGDWRGKYADEETARKIAWLIHEKKLWRVPVLAEEEETAQQAPLAVAVQEAHSSLEEVQEGSSSSSSGSQGADEDSEEGIGPFSLSTNELSLNQVEMQLSQLLGHSRKFKLRFSPEKHIALIDLSSIISGISTNDAAIVVRRILGKHPEIKTLKLKFSGRGQKSIDTLPLQDVLGFVFLLPGKMAAQVRFQAAKLLVHFIGGDAALSMLAKAAASVKPRLGCLRNDHLYVMQYDFDASSVKIGRSDDVEKRRKTLEACQNFKVIVRKVYPGMGHMESSIHRRLRGYSSRKGSGREWFQMTPPDASMIIERMFLKAKLWKGAGNLFARNKKPRTPHSCSHLSPNQPASRGGESRRPF
jgi:T5orf172 domain